MVEGQAGIREGDKKGAIKKGNHKKVCPTTILTVNTDLLVEGIGGANVLVMGGLGAPMC